MQGNSNSVSERELIIKQSKLIETTTNTGSNARENRGGHKRDLK